MISVSDYVSQTARTGWQFFCVDNPHPNKDTGSLSSSKSEHKDEGKHW